MAKTINISALDEQFKKNCKVIDLKYEYTDYIGSVRWAVITDLTETEILERYPEQINPYTPFIVLSPAFGEVRDEFMRSENKHRTEADKLPLGEVKSDFGLDLGKVVGDIYIGHCQPPSLGQFVPKSRIVGSTSLPHTSQPGGVWRANSSTRGRSPIRATILSRASSGFLLWASMGEMINWWMFAACRLGWPRVSENQADYVENHVSSIGESVAQNGVTATLEGALTDGTTAFILIDIAAPDGQNIEALPLGFDIEFDKLKLEGQENEHISSISATCFMIDDNDGKENTASMLIQYNVYQLLDSNFSLADGKNRTLRLRDLFYHEKEYPYSRCTVAEGEWAFEFAFTPVDTEEVELLNESISASYTQISGKHVEAEITSVLMKGLSASVYYRLAPHEIQEAGDFGILEFVMKDGRVIEAYPKKAGQTVQIDNGDIVPDTRCHYCTYVFSAPIDHADVAELHIGENVIAVNAQ